MYGGMNASDAAAFKQAFGFAPDDCDVEIWPDVWDSYRLFSAMRTQWRIGMNGPTGLDYNPLSMLAQAHNISDLTSIIKDIQIMEAKALEVMHSK